MNYATRPVGAPTGTKKDIRVIEAGKHSAKAESGSYDVIVTRDGEELQCIRVIFRLQNGKTVEWPAFFGSDEERNQKSLDALGYCGWQGTNPEDMTGIDRNVVQLVIEDRERVDKRGEKVLYSAVKYVNKAYDKAKPHASTHKSSELRSKIEALRRRPAEASAILQALGDDYVPF